MEVTIDFLGWEIFKHSKNSGSPTCDDGLSNTIISYLSNKMDKGNINRSATIIINYWIVCKIEWENTNLNLNLKIIYLSRSNSTIFFLNSSFQGRINSLKLQYSRTYEEIIWSRITWKSIEWMREIGQFRKEVNVEQSLIGRWTAKV